MDPNSYYKLFPSERTSNKFITRDINATNTEITHWNDLPCYLTIQVFQIDLMTSPGDYLY